MSQPVVQLNPGDTVPLGTILANIHMIGVATDPSTPNMFGATFEMFGDQGVLTVPVLQGPPGPQGNPQFALRFMSDNLASPSDLPNNLTDTDADIGKYWIFETVDNNGNVTGTSAYIWYGTEYRQMPMGSQGPPGPYPVITPVVDLLDPSLTSYIEVSGPASNPQWKLNLAVPAGPPGPSAALGSCPDVNMSTPPIAGQVLGFNGNYTLSGQPIWQPMWVGDILPAPYTIPEAAFTSYSGITQGRQIVCTWEAPAQQWPWKPWVTGQIDVGGIDISLNAAGLGAEVRLNDPNTGPLVGVGTGTNGVNSRVTIVPHTSSSANRSDAITPTNSFAKVEAGQTATIYVTLVNEGWATLYNFSASGAGLGVLALPMGTEKAIPTTYFGTFTARVNLGATWSLVSGS